MGQVQQHKDVDSAKNVGKIKAILRDIWSEVLREDPADIADDDIFFTIGGNSISALNVSTAAERRGISLSVKQIFMNPSLEEMAAEAQFVKTPVNPKPNYPTPPGSVYAGFEEFHDEIQTIAETSGLHPHDIEAIYPCTSMQESLVAMSDETPNLYVRQLVYRIQSHVSLGEFQQAWASTVQANPVLRTRVYPPSLTTRYLQAVIDEEISWNLGSDLATALTKDLEVPMRSGDSFFRYNLVRASSEEMYFIWTVHHALVDGASVSSLLDEVSRRYCGEQVSSRPKFEDFVRYTTDAEKVARSQLYWHETLLKANPASYPSISPESSSLVTPTSVLNRTLHLADKTPLTRGVTKPHVLEAAWGILMSQYLGCEDVLFGTILSGRGSSDVAGIDRMTGPTINVLPVSLKIDRAASVSKFLEKVQRQAVEMMSFEQASLAQIRKSLAAKASTAADFNTLLVVQPADFQTQTASYLQKLGLEYLDGTGKREQHSHPLVITLTLSTDESVQARVEYDEAITSSEHIGNLLSQFQSILNQLSNATTNTSVGSITALSDEDIIQIREWNKWTPPVEQLTYPELFRRQVCKQPHAEAICSTDLSLTYAEVESCSTILAERLIEYGALPQSSVAVCFEKSIWTFIAILATFKAGCVYLPIDPSHPPGRIAEILETAQARLALASPTGAQALNGLCEILTVDNPPLSRMLRSFSRLPTVDPSETAYILFTSGSTGKPKGMVISHSSICTSILHHGAAFQADQKWRTLQFCAHTFDISVAEFLTTLAFGGCLCVPSDDERLNDLSGTISRLNVDTLLVVPTVANLLEPELVPSLKRIVLGGEPVPVETFRRWADHVWLTAGYGPSETSIYSAANFGVSKDTNTACVGKSIGCSQWIVDPEDHNKLNAIGVVGELVISGATLAKEYLGDPVQTKASFVPAPAWLKVVQPESEYNMIYKSGDLARYNPDGSFNIIGRKDTQVKLRGLRIELGEIEKRCMEHGSPSAVLAVLPKIGPCKEQIVGVLSLQRSGLGGRTSTDVTLLSDGARANAKDILESLTDHVALTLPAYMVPTLWIVLEAMPLLVSGKVDRKKLKLWIDAMDPDTYAKLLRSNRSDSETDMSVIAGSPADTLRQIWGAHLGYSVDQIGPNSTYISLGGDSIAAMRIVSEARQKGLAVSVRQLLSQTTLEQMARRASAASQMTSDTSENETNETSDKLMKTYEADIHSRLSCQPQAEISDSYPVPPIQRLIRKAREADPRIFLLSWNMEVFSKDITPLSLSRLGEAWKRVVRKHPIFRTIFFKSADAQVPELQLVLNKVEPEFKMSSIAPGDPVPLLDEVLPPVDECFLPHRAHFYQHGDRYFAHIELDHRLFDGWSFALVKKEILTQYEATEEQSLGNPVAYRNFVAYHNKERVEMDTEYWKSTLGGLETCLLNFKPSYNIATPATGQLKTIHYLPKMPVQAISKFSSMNRVTSASVFYAAWAQTLASVVRSKEVSFEYVVWGRDKDIPDILDVIGPTLNVLPFHLEDVDGGDQADPVILADLARRIQEQRLQDSTYTACDPREVIEDELHQSLPFNTAVNFQRRPTGVETETIKVDDDLTKSVDPWHFDVMVRVIHVEDDDTYFMAMEFDERVFDRHRMREVMDMFHDKVKVAYE